MMLAIIVILSYSPSYKVGKAGRAKLQLKEKPKTNQSKATPSPLPLKTKLITLHIS
jgi:hypothetical protein